MESYEQAIERQPKHPLEPRERQEIRHVLEEKRGNSHVRAFLRRVSAWVAGAVAIAGAAATVIQTFRGH